MLSRKQFTLVQTARGLSPEEIVARSGIPPQSFVVLMESDSRDGRDPSKLISESTFRRLAMVLSLDPGMTGLRNNSVIEWRVNTKRRAEWQEAVEQLRTDLFSSSIEMTVVNLAGGGLFRKKESIVLIYDHETQVKLAVTKANPKVARFLKTAFGIEKPRMISMEEKEFIFTAKLIEHGVYRSNQFFIVLGGRAVRYTWADVQAAAKEFNFTTDSLIDLMVKTVSETSSPSQDMSTEYGTSVDDRPALRIAAG